MKELSEGKCAQEKESDKKVEGVDSKNVSEKMVHRNIKSEEKDERVNVGPQESEDSDDKIINTLSEDIEKLNIKPDQKDEAGEYVKRGPTGGIASAMPATSLGYHSKHIPMGPMGNYVPPQMPQVSYQMEKKGNRRALDDPDDQPTKFYRPPVYQFNNLQDFDQGGSLPNFQNNCRGMNNLSQCMDPGMVSEPFLNFYGQQNFGMGHDSSLTTTKLKSPTGMSGGEVTVNTPVVNNQTSGPFNFADDLIDEIDQRNFQQMNAGNLPNLEDSFIGESFKEMRRRSDPADSGIDSDNGSPWSEAAASPGSCSYTSPPSVESGYGKSPLHEIQYQQGMSPHYPGSTSPASFRGTPSPAGTSGYGSPGQPILEDSNDFINSELLEDAMAVITADLNTQDEMKRRQMQQFQAASQSFNPQRIITTIPATPLQPAQLRSTQSPMTGSILRPPMMIPGAPLQGLPNQTIATTSFLPVTTTAQPQQIIIFQPTQQQQTANGQPVILLPIQTSPAPQKKSGVTQYKKIAPKLTTSANTATTSASSVATASKSGTVLSGSNKGNVANKNVSQQNAQAQQQQNKLLMIARRTVADIPREDLRKSDDEGDTYLHIAVCKTDKHMVQALLERLHREKLMHLVDQENLKRQTPLYLAAFINQPIMVAMFIKFQANVNVLAQNLSSDGLTTEVKSAIHVAASQGVEYHRTLVELLKAKDISINIVNNYGQTALHCAILAHGKLKRNSQDRIESTEIIQTLIKAGADPSAQDKKSGKTPLMYAIEQKSLHLVETILNVVDPDKVKNVVKTQAFDGSSCLKIAESLKGSLDVNIWNKLWNVLQCAASGSVARFQYQPQQVQVF